MPAIRLLQLTLLLGFFLVTLAGCNTMGSKGSVNFGNEKNLWDVVADGMEMKHPKNARVKKQLSWYKAHPRHLEKMVENARPYLYEIVAEVKRQGLPMELALLPAIESNYQTTVYSHSGAAGLWQFIPSTGKAYGLHQTTLVDKRRDPLHSTEAALKYLKYLNRYFDGDWELAIAAYNAGEGTIGRARKRNEKRGKKSDYWHLDLRKETMEYVPRLLALSEIVANPRKYNVTLQPISTKQHLTTVSVDKSVDLRKVAQDCNINADDFCALNAAYVKNITPGHGSNHIVVEKRHATKVQRSLPKQPEADWQQIVAKENKKKSAKTLTYKVKKGDTLSGISRRHGTSVSQIKRDNKLKSNNLRIGQKLKINSSKRVASSSGSKSSKSSKPRSHKVQKGETLYSISKKYGVSIKSLQSTNGMGKKTNLKPGQKLKIPQSRKA